MKGKIGLIHFFLIALFFSGCKENKTDTNQIESGTEQAEILNNKFDYSGYIITLNVVVKNDDEFLINFISEYESDNKFIIENVIKSEVKGSSEVQSISFKVPEDVDELRRLRFNFGKNRQQKPIGFKNIIIKRKSKELTLNIKQIKRFFFPNAYLDINYENSILSPKEDQGRYNPFIMSKWSLSSLITNNL